jgi:hypothetical protein
MGQSASVAGRHPGLGPPPPFAELSLPFRNAAGTGQSAVEIVIPLRAAAPGANLKL